ncbi:MAG: 50S ribosomal protein L34 [Patescibacteria group bacterium]
MPKRTFQPNTKRAKRKHGFLKRMRTKDGQDIIKRRKDKGRKRLTK